MTIGEIKDLIAKGEGANIEFKTCQNEITHSVYETVCSFLNHSGGYIFIGINDQGEILGVNKMNVEQMKKNFIHIINNPDLFSPKAYVTPEDIEIDQKKIIYARVEKSLYVHRYKNRFYDRNGDADVDVTDHPALMAGLFARKDTLSYENKIIPYLGLEDLDKKTFDYCRKLVKLINETHPWIKLSDEEILKSCGLIAKDPTTGQTGIKSAALLLFGTDVSLATFMPAYRIEAIYRNMSFKRFKQNKVEDTTRYDDRITIRSNLINAYETLMSFVYKHLPEKFYLEDGTTQRGDLRSNIFREIVANLCVHREYSNNAAGFFEIYSDCVITRNVTKFTPMFKTGVISIEELDNYTKNPLLVKVFRELGWVEELGSGSRNIKKFAPLYFEKSIIEIVNGEDFIFSITYNAVDDNGAKLDEAGVKLEGDSVKPDRSSVNLDADSIKSNRDSVKKEESNDTTNTIDNAKPVIHDTTVTEEKILKLLNTYDASLTQKIKKRMVKEIMLIYQEGKVDKATLSQELKHSPTQMKGDLRTLLQYKILIYSNLGKVYSLSDTFFENLNKE
ncbi:RNA-binding domain-containing protein [Parabacteroides sp. AM08-6]|uniref:RNA-binding domain-containing protein n=1 Tax=Parabacteroides sp. AM08-6 TaxID=2292053 RepID=UPI000EFE24FE|nr:RNA-binding domain-containing protein [Parabacteroides sp. AM08-6]RHJ84799.1 AAA family ATPase [Parabacteroides sp. AM08-6]